MVKIFGIKIFEPKAPTPSAALGPVYQTPSEASKQSGGTVSTTNPGIPSAYQGSASEQQASRTSGGGGSSRGSSGGGSSAITNVQEALRSGGGLSPSDPASPIKKITTQRDLRVNPNVLRELDKRDGGRTETYNYRTNTYETTRDPYSQYGTREIVNTRRPTQEEQRRIDILESYGVTANVDKLEQDIKETKVITGKIDRVVTDLNKDVKTLEAVDKSIESLIKDKVNDKGEFTGTQAEYKNYLKNLEARDKLYSDYEKKVKEYDILEQKKAVRDRTIKFSYFGGKEETFKASDFSEKGLGTQILLQAGISAKNIYWKTVGENFAKDYSSTIGNIKVGMRPQAVLDLNTKTYRLATDSDRGTIGKNILTPTQVQEGVTTIGKTATYFIPYAGQAFILGETGMDVQRNYGGNVIQFIKDNPVEAGLVVGGLALGGVFAGARVLKNVRVSKAVTKELEILEKVKLKGIGIKRDLTGAYYLEAVRKGDKTKQVIKFKTKQVIKFYGRVEKGKNGFEFIPSGTGQRATVGIVTPEKATIKFQVLENTKGQPRLDISKSSKKLEPMFFSRVDEFQVTVGGKYFLKGRLSDVPTKIGDLTLFNTGKFARRTRVYGDLSMTGVVPTKTKFGITSLDKSKKRILKDIEKQFKKERKLETSTLDIEFPKADRNILQLNKNKALVISPQEEILLARIPKNEVKSFGGVNVKGEKSSPEFLQDMWKPQSQVLVPPKMKPKTIKYVVKRKLESPTAFPSAAESSARLGTRTNFQTEISGLPIGGSSFAGTGMYERVESVSPIEVPVIRDNILVRDEFVVKPVVRGGTKRKSEVKPLEILKTSPIEAVKFETAQKDIVKLKDLLKVGQKERQFERQRAQQRTEIKQKIEVVKTPFAVPSSQLQRIAQKIDNGDFEIFKKVKGVFKKVGESETLFGAGTKLKKSLLKDLSASGFVVNPKGEKVKASEFTSGLFRVSKQKGKDFLLVQRSEKGLKGGRLSTGGEISEILKSKRSKKKKRGFKWFS